MVLQRLKKILARFRSENTSASIENGHTIHAVPETWEDNLSLTLNSLVTERGSKSYGTVQAISLENFRIAIGPLWQQYEMQILLITETTIERMLERGQTCIPCEYETWLLVLPGLSEKEAQKRADTIAAAIGEKLIGARFEGAEKPLPATTLIDIGNAINDDGSINREDLKQAVERARETITGSPPTRNTAASSVCAERNIKLTYVPAWCAESQAIDTFYCRPIGTDGANPLKRNNRNLIAANAVAVTRASIVVLNKMIQDGVRAKLAIPLPFAVLRNPFLEQVLASIRAMPQEQRYLHLRLEIIEVPPTVSLSALKNVRDSLAPLARDIAILTNIHRPNETVLTLANVIIGAEITDYELTSGSIDPTSALKNFKYLAGTHNTYTLGLTTNRALKAAVQLGYGEVGGPSLRETLRRRPTIVEGISIDTLLNI